MLDIEELSPLPLSAFNYWLGKTPKVGIPGRQDIDPIEIPSLLPWIALTDIHRVDGGYKFSSRLAA